METRGRSVKKRKGSREGKGERKEGRRGMTESHKKTQQKEY